MLKNKSKNRVAFYFSRSILICTLIIIFGCAKDKEPKSDENRILSFEIFVDGQYYRGQVNHFSKEISINTIGLERESDLVADIEISEFASISPDPEIPQDFMNPVDYTVTAQNGEKSTYRVITSNTRALSEEKKILSVSMEFEGKTYEAVIDQVDKIIDITLPLNAGGELVDIEISEGASLAYSYEEGFINYSYPAIFTVTAEDGSTVDYQYNPFLIGFNSLRAIYYSNAIPLISGLNINLNLPNSSLVLENDKNSYVLEYSNYETYDREDLLGVENNFLIHFPENIVSADNYELKYKVSGETLSTYRREFDVVSGDVPKITGVNRERFVRGDTLIIYGENLAPGVLIRAHNGRGYAYNGHYVKLNSEKTELRVPLTNNYSMFPSYHAKYEDVPTPIYIYYQAREGDSTIVDFY